MRIGTDKLIIKALTALEEVGWQAQKAPIPPSHLLRFTLAYLYEHSGGDRAPFDTLWRYATDAGTLSQSTETSTNIVRSNSVSRELYGVYKAVGVYRSTDMIFSWLPADKRQGKVGI